MKLSLEVKGYVQDALATKIYSWAKIKTFGKRVGVDTSFIDEDTFVKRKACEYIIENLPKDSGEIVVKTLLDMAKRGLWNGDYSEKILLEINPIMERTMNCRIDENGEITPIFPWLEEEQKNLILKKLKAFAFDKGFNSYKDALDTYEISPKGSLGLLRATLEGIVDDILKSKGTSSTNSQKDNFAKLKDLGILNEISSQECSRCHHKKRDHEFNYSYNTYGLLSHYGSHKELVTEELANLIFTSTSAFIWFLINRYETLR